eukprot:CAMPEP_0172477254 /NCGR_PEP_ID=MMETSP1066-20121228/206_1 /TAXON_ID=671091 /ORGANISM="Coscinodiscus wailesii, Strain CCMP2513" /LENGTH=217 /DNA_ID=CAMNT_0013235555 /DNA_START=33 /DNA_END=686 /DNA_ORIENTATION=+
MKLALATLIAILGIHGGSTTCAPVTTQENFSLTSYINGTWYIHQQAPIAYLPVSRNYCVKAQYNLFNDPTFWGYSVEVNNYAEDVDGNSYGGKLCAIPDKKSRDPAKLKVAPCFLPKFTAGPYWVIAYDESKGYALVSGGQPTIDTGNGCVSGDGVNNSGLWVFLRSRERDEAAIAEVRDIASAQGFDLSILNDVNQTNCERGDETKEEWGGPTTVI